MKGFFCKLILFCAQAADPEGYSPDRVELAYGEVLFSYYQQNFDAALLGVEVARAQGHTAGAEMRFRLADASFSFKARMFDRAQAKLDEIQTRYPTELTALDRLRLAFHLAREHYRTGDYTALASELDKIELGTRRFGAKRFHPEVEFMRAEVALAAGDLTRAQALLDGLPKHDEHRLYGYFNLASLLRERDDPVAALAVFGALVESKPQTEAGRDIRSRAMLARAYLEREQGEAAAARRALTSIPAEGRYRDLGMASYGSLAMAEGDYELAARIWLALQQDANWSPSTASAALAFPLSLENMGREQLALGHYRAAETRFNNRALKLDELIARAEEPEWIRGLLDGLASDFSDPEIVADWQARIGHTDWLEWLAAEGSHELVEQWRHLRSERDYLARLPEHLEFLALVATEQQRRGAAVRDALADDGLLVRHEALVADLAVRRERYYLLRDTNPAQTNDWLTAMANPDERAMLERLARMAELSAALEPEAAAQWRERLERLRGVLFWQLVDDSAVRLRGMQRDIDHAQKLADRLESQAERMQAAEAVFSAGIMTDFSELRARAGDSLARVDAALVEREEMIAQALIEGMRQEARSLQGYLVSARVGIARAMDRAVAVIDASPEAQP
ncbi:MAG: hypothetical protein AAF515_17845 [Pseudomonadota bacterium]